MIDGSTGRVRARNSIRWGVMLIGISAILGCTVKKEPASIRPEQATFEAGAIRPDWGSVEKKPCSYVMEMNGSAPAHEGETVWVEGVATMGTGVMADHRYFKIHIQDATGGVYVFADMEAEGQEAGSDGGSFAALTVRPGARVAVKGTIATHKGMVELRPPSGSSLAVIARGEPVPAPHVFASIREVLQSEFEYAGDLVRINGVRLRGPDPSSQWPRRGQEAKGIELVDSRAGTSDEPQAVRLVIRPGSGIPGSDPPSGSFDIVGVLHRRIDETGRWYYVLFPRALSDIVLP